MSSAKPLREFEPMHWVPMDYGEVFDKRRPFPNLKGMARALEVDFPPEKKKRKIHTTLKPPVRYFKSSLEMKKWIWNTWPR
jgi:hypothetical protein